MAKIADVVKLKTGYANFFVGAGFVGAGFIPARPPNNDHAFGRG